MRTFNRRVAFEPLTHELSGLCFNPPLDRRGVLAPVVDSEREQEISCLIMEWYNDVAQRPRFTRDEQKAAQFRAAYSVNSAEPSLADHWLDAYRELFVARGLCSEEWAFEPQRAYRGLMDSAVTASDNIRLFGYLLADPEGARTAEALARTMVSRLGYEDAGSWGIRWCPAAHSPVVTASVEAGFSRQSTQTWEAWSSPLGVTGISARVDPMTPRKWPVAESVAVQGIRAVYPYMRTRGLIPDPLFDTVLDLPKAKVLLPQLPYAHPAFVAWGHLVCRARLAEQFRASAWEAMLDLWGTGYALVGVLDYARTIVLACPVV